MARTKRSICETTYFLIAFFDKSKLQGAYLREARLQGAYLIRAQLQEVDLCEVVLADEHHHGPRLADVQWGDTNLAVVDWSQITKLGDEYVATQEIDKYIRKKDEKVRLGDYKTAVRANRQLAVVLRDQGLNEEADHFAYRAQLLQRVVWRLQKRPLKFVLSWVLNLLAGYGYRPGRTLGWYLFVIIGFAIAYSMLGHLPLLPDTLVFSLMSFHGRGFFPSRSGETALHNPLVVLAAAEAVMGLLIEISVIAPFTQRFFGK